MSVENKKKLIEKSNNAWQRLSAWWDNDIQGGDPFHRYLVFPGMLRLIDCKPKQKILDIGCGNGALSRRLFDRGVDVLGVDISEIFVEKAIEKSDSMMRYQVLDATSESELLNLSSLEKFDVVVCSMVLHDLPVIEPLLNTLSKLLRPNGCVVFSIPHPCFNMGEVRLDFFSESPHVSRARYVNAGHLEMKSKKNQPISQHCFHRSLAELFQSFFSVGMVLDRLEEPSVSQVKEEMKSVDLDWKLLPEIPPALLCRWVFK